jgi:hypothetical protein
MSKPKTSAEKEQEDKDVAIILFCAFVMFTFFVIGMLTSVYVLIFGLALGIVIYEWFFLVLPLRRRRKP